MQSTKSVPAVERAFAMLEALDLSKNGMNIADLSRKLRIPRSSAHTIALTLERCGYLTRDASQRNCRLSTKAYMLGRQSISSEKIAQAAVASMRRLSTQTMLTSHLAVLEQSQATYIQKVQVPGFSKIDTFVGQRTNLHCTAVGKVLLAYAPVSFRSSVLSRGTFARYTRYTITTSGALRTELQRVLENGYACDNQEEELEVRCLAVPVFNARGEFIAALSIAGNTQQISDEVRMNAVARLRQTAFLVSDELTREGANHA